MIGLYFGGGIFQTIFGNEFGNIELDANLDEQHEWQAEATMNPVEEGSPITDHVIEQPDKLRIKGFVSETPLTTSLNLSSIFNSQSITQPVFDLLRKLIKEKAVMTVYTKYRIYDNMVLTSLNIPRSPGGGEAIEFTAEFVNIRMVATQTVDVPKGISAKKDKKASKAVGNKAEPKKDGGKKQPEQKTEPAKASSVFSRATKSVLN